MKSTLNYIEHLLESCRAAQTAVPLRTFVTTTLEHFTNNDRGVYVFEQIGGDPDSTVLAFEQFKAKRERACPRINKSGSSVLYVGSSSKNLLTRLRQHQGDGPSATSALHLRHWFQGDYRIRVLLYDVSQPVLQILEDSLAHELRPAFGKRGSNNR